MKAAWACALSAAMSLCFSVRPAVADLKLCNRTSYVLYAATAAVTTNQIASQGWSRIVPGACSTVVRGDLRSAAYFVYARSSNAHSGPTRAWGGDRAFCAKDKSFVSRQPPSAQGCSLDNFFSLPFAAIDTHRNASWTMILSETPTISTLEGASTAGIKHLLKDLGYRIAFIEGPADKTSDAALADFRRRAHVSATATKADLFDALETGAMKVTAPAGYSICNDTASPLAAAIGQRDGAAWVSRGWWKIEAASCARAITEPLHAESIYLFAQKIGGTATVTGHYKFCVADIEFDIQGRTRCKDRGLHEIGFAETRVRNRAGYAAHIGETGLITPGYSATLK